MNVNNLKRTRELNGINSLEFETDKKIEKGNRVVFKDYQGIWNEYIVQEVENLHEGLKIEYSVFCEQSINELFGHFISDLKPRETKATAIVDKVLQDTRFSVGHVDDLGLKSFNLYHIDAKSALWKIIDIYDCDIDVSIDVKDSKVVGRYINLYKHKGSFVGKRYTYKKDIKSIKKTIDYTNIATKLYGYGKGEEIVDEYGKSTGGYGRKIDFSEINGGKSYITNEEARLKYGVGKEKRHIEGIFEDGDCEDKKELLELTKKELEKRSKPQISYELKVEDLSKYPRFEFEGVGLGDDVIVKDKELDLTVYTRIIKIIDSPFDNSDTEITLGNYIKDISNKFLEYENLRKSIESRNISIGEEIDKLAKSTEQGFLKSLVDRLNTELNATGGYVYFEQGKGIIILNAPKEGNPTQAITLKGGTIAIANKKKANGDWDWTTFGTGNGFTASILTAGILKGGKVRWNLEDGTLLIGNSPDDYNLYWDGETLNLRNTKIDFRYDKNFIELKNNIDKKISKEDILEDKEIQEALKGKDGLPGEKGKDGKSGRLGKNLLLDSFKEAEGIKEFLINYDYAEKIEADEELTLTIKIDKALEESTSLSAYNGKDTLLGELIQSEKDKTKYVLTFNYLESKDDIKKLYIYLTNPTEKTYTIKWAVLARGDVEALDWYGAEEDLQKQIDSKASEESLQDLQVHFAMYPTAEELNQNKVDLIKQQAYLDQLKTAIDSNALTLEERLSVIEANVGAGKLSLEAINTYLHFGEEGVLIGKEGEQVRLRLINNALEITDGTKVVARFANNQTETPNLKVTGAFEFGYHVANKVDLDGNKYTVIRSNI